MFGAQIHNYDHNVVETLLLKLQNFLLHVMLMTSYYVCPLYLVCYDTLPAAVDVGTHKW